MTQLTLPKNASLVWGCLFINFLVPTQAFSTPGLVMKPSFDVSNSHMRSFTTTSSTTRLFAAGGGKKKRRRRKEPPSAPVPASTPPAVEESKVVEEEVIQQPAVKAEVKEPKEPEPEPVEKKSTAKQATPGAFTFDRDEAIALGISDAEDEEDIIPQFAPPKSLSKGAVELPSFTDAVQRKKKKPSSDKTKGDDDDDDEEDNKPKIDRSDISSFKRLLEVEPNADTDMTYFNKEEYGTVSALLAEGAQPFLGIPSGPLQVGHFIGALGICLMAFVEYPGFPLTNLPSPLRGALQGGLGTVYAINTVLAVFAVFQAKERGQPAGLWAAKTFSVGGLAYDQLTQLPTLKQIEERMSKKGKRAWKNQKK